MLLIRLSGHSGAGKSRLLAALVKRNIKHRRAILYTSRQPRIGEVDGQDYHFCSRNKIEELPKVKFYIGEVHEMLQAVDLIQLEHDLQSNEPVIVEIFHALWPGLEMEIKRRMRESLVTASVFLTAINPDIIKQLPKNYAADKIRNEVKKITHYCHII